MRYLYPIPYNLNFFDKLIYKLKKGYFFCTVCGKISYLHINKEIVKNPELELRESIICKHCKASNRNRQMAKIITQSPHNKKKYLSLKSFCKNEKIKIYNTESSRALHDIIKANNPSLYHCSEYLGDKYTSGDAINGVVHQDLMKTSFQNDYFDLVLTSDVLEHVPDPWRAFEEIYRILKPGGRHVFTVPFYQDRCSGERRAYIDRNGNIIHEKEPIYHIDPLRPEGAFVFAIFSIDMLSKLEEIGFKTYMYKLHSMFEGILGQNAIIFESFK